MEAEARGTTGTTLADQVQRLVQSGGIAVKQTDLQRAVELSAMKADDLRKIAKEAGLTGYSSMKKDALVAAIVTDEIAKGVIVATQPDQPADSAKGATNGSGTNGNGTAHAAPAAEIKVGDELTGTVSGINGVVGGMFITLGDGKSGLAHSNQIGLEGEGRRTTMARLETVFKSGDEVQVRVVRVKTNERNGKLEIGLELIGASREQFVAATVERQEADDRSGTTDDNGNGGTNEGAKTEERAPELDKRPTSPEDEVRFRAEEAVGPVADVILRLDLQRVVDEGVARSGGDSRKKALTLRDMIRERGLNSELGKKGVRTFVEDLKDAAWRGRSFTREQAKDIAYTFAGVGLGCMPGMPRRDSEYLFSLLRPFVDKTLPPDQRAYDFADVVDEEVVQKKQAAVERREERVSHLVSAFDLVPDGRPSRPSASTTAITTSEPEVGTIYDGKVVNVPEQGYGVFVEFGSWKGLVYIGTMPGRPSFEDLEREYPADKPVRVKFLEKTSKGYALQFEEHTGKVTPKSQTVRGQYPRMGDLHADAEVLKIGDFGDTIVVMFAGWRGAIYIRDIGWEAPRNDRERADTKERLESAYPKGRQLCVEVTRVERKPDRDGKMRDRFTLKTVEPHEFAQRKGRTHGQGGGASRPATAAKPAADDSEAERAPAGQTTAAPEERRETVEVDLDQVTGKPVECKQDPDSGTCVNHSNGQPTTMMPGEAFCRIGRELIRQGGVPVTVEKEAEAPTTDGGTTQAAPAATVTRRGDGNVPSLMINTVTFRDLEKLLASKGEEVTRDDAETLDEIGGGLVAGRVLLTKQQAWEWKEKMLSLGKKYGAGEELMDRLVRRSFGTPEQVAVDQRYAEARAFKKRLAQEGREFVCMANGGLGGHKTPWFIPPERTNQLHPELSEILLAVVPERHAARPMATRLAKEAEDGLTLCLKCADRRVGWLQDLLAENGLTRGPEHDRLKEICPANNSGTKAQVFSFINREPSPKARDAYEAAAAEKKERAAAAEAAKDPAPKLGDDSETARVKKIARARQGGAFSPDPRPSSDYADRKDAARQRSADDLKDRSYRGKGKQKDGDGGGKKKGKGKK